MADRIEAIGMKLPPQTPVFPQIKPFGIEIIADSAWTEMMEGSAGNPTQAHKAAMALGKEEWSKHERLVRYVRDIWGSSRSMKVEHILKQNAQSSGSGAAAAAAAINGAGVN